MAAAAAASEQVQEAVQAAPPAAKKATAKAAVEVTLVQRSWQADTAGCFDPEGIAELLDGSSQKGPPFSWSDSHSSILLTSLLLHRLCWMLQQTHRQRRRPRPRRRLWLPDLPARTAEQRSFLACHMLGSVLDKAFGRYH